jgi:hypothetical protein
MFLSESAAPTALQMPQTAQVKEKSSPPPSNGTPCDLALPRGTEFHTACKRRPKLNRQWLAYLHHAAGLHTADDIAAVLTQLDWPKLTNGRDGSIIEVFPCVPFPGRTTGVSMPCPGLTTVTRRSASLRGPRR